MMNKQLVMTSDVFAMNLSQCSVPSDVAAILINKFEGISSLKQVEVCVPSYGGLRAVIYRSGRVVFIYRYRAKAGSKQFAIGALTPRKCSFFDLMAQFALLKNQLSNGIEVLEASHLPLQMSQFFHEQYLPFAKSIKKSWRDDLSRFATWIEPTMGGLSVSSIQPSHIQQIFVKDPEFAQRSFATRNRVLALLRAVFKFAESHNLITSNPVGNFKLLPERNIRTRVLKGVELARVMVALTEEMDRKAAAFILILLHSAMRCGELRFSRWDDLDLESGTLVLDGLRTKNSKTRVVPLSPAAVAAFKMITPVEGNDYIFASQISAGAMTFPRRAFERMKARAGISNLRPHDLRRTAASLALNAGVSMSTVSKLLGHSSTAVTESRYAFFDQNSLNNAAKTLGDAIAFASNS